MRRRERVDARREWASDRRQQADELRQRAQERSRQAGEAAHEAWRNPRLTFRRLFGLDRSGPPPPATGADAPWNPWTIPNAIGLVRLLLIPLMLFYGLRDGEGGDATAATLFAAIAWSDYLDGIAARVTGQYSKLGALLDPLVDRLLVLAGLVICWKFSLLPYWGVIALGVRELYVMVAAEYVIRHGQVLSINWFGRLGVWPTMSAIFFAMTGLRTTALVLLVAGLAMGMVAAAIYTRDAVALLRHKPSTGA